MLLFINEQQHQLKLDNLSQSYYRVSLRNVSAVIRVHHYNLIICRSRTPVFHLLVIVLLLGMHHLK